MLLLASVGFISATWSQLGIGVRAIALLSFSAIFVFAGILARAKFKLTNTSLAFYSIGSAALPITIIGASAFQLLGDTFGLKTPALYSTILLSFGSLLLLLGFGAAFFRSRVFAAGALICSSICFFTLAIMFDYPYSLNVLMIAIFASTFIFLAPYIKKIPDTSAFSPFGKVITVFSILNLYAMTLIALTISKTNTLSGIFLLLLAVTFFAAVILKQETGLLSLPSIVLILVGLAQIIRMNSLLGTLIWILVSGVTFVALSYVPYFKKIFSYVLMGFGLFFLIGSAFPILLYASEYDNWGYLALALVPCIVLTFLAIQKKRPIIFSGAILPAFTILYFTAVRLLSFSTPYSETADDYLRIGHSPYMLDAAIAALTGLIIVGILYALFSFLPHQKLYTSTGNILLFALLVIFGQSLADSIDDKYSMTRFLINLGFVIFSLIMGSRTDRLNIRDNTVKEMPASIRANRFFYAVIWPLFILLFFTGFSIHLTSSVSADTELRILITALLLFIVLLFAFTAYLTIRAGSGRSAFFGQPSRAQLPSSSSASASASSNSPTSSVSSSASSALTNMPLSRVASTWASAITMLILILFLTPFETANLSGAKNLYVLQHLIPLLIPIFCVLLLLLEKHSSSISGSRGTAFGYTLAALISFSVVLPYTLSMRRGFGVDSFLLEPSFFFAVLALIAVFFFVSRHFLGHPEEHFAGRPLTDLSFALLLWTIAISGLLFLGYILHIISDPYMLYGIMLLLICAGFMILYNRKYTPACTISAMAATVIFMQTISVNVLPVCSLPTWLSVFLFQIPVLAYCITVLIRKTEPLSKEPFFLGALLSQCLITLIVPMLTLTASRDLAKSAYEYKEYAHTSRILDHIYRGMSFSFAPSRFLIFTLFGFLLIELVMFLRSGNSAGRKRALALLIVTLSTIVWMPVGKLPSISNLIEACYLIPFTLFFILLPWIFHPKDSSTIPTARLVYACSAMGLLALLTLNTDDTFCLILFGIISFVLLLGGYASRKKGFLILGTVCVLGMIAFIANRVWGDMAWWIYLFMTGTILVTIAVRNEIKKRR